MKYTPYSHSKIATYKSCPRLFQYLYIEKRDKPQTVPMLIGSCFHQFIAEYSILKEQLLNTDENKIWSNLYQDADKKIKYQENVILEAKDIWSIYKKKFEKEWINDIKKQFEIQYGINPFYKEISFDSESCFFRVIIDRLEFKDNKIIITDYKTGWSKNIDIQQCLIYAWALSKIIPFDTITVRYEHVRLLTTDEYTISQIELNNIQKDVLTSIAQIEVDIEFKPTPNDNCQYCSFLQECPATKNMLEMIKNNSTINLTSEENVKNIADIIILAEAWTKQAKDKLKLYHDQYGTITTEKGIWSKQRTLTRSIDPVKFFEIITKIGDNPLLYMSVNNIKAKKYLELEEIKNITDEKIEYRFGFQKSA